MKFVGFLFVFFTLLTFSSACVWEGEEIFYSAANMNTYDLCQKFVLTDRGVYPDVVPNLLTVFAPEVHIYFNDGLIAANATQYVADLLGTIEELTFRELQTILYGDLTVNNEKQCFYHYTEVVTMLNGTTGVPSCNWFHHATTKVEFKNDGLIKSVHSYFNENETTDGILACLTGEFVDKKRQDAIWTAAATNKVLGYMLQVTTSASLGYTSGSS